MKMFRKFTFLINVLILSIKVSAHYNCAGANCMGGGTICPSGFQLSGNACVQPSTTMCAVGGSGPCHVCPSGYFAQGGQCQRYTCPDNYIFWNGQCQIPPTHCYHSCQAGYSFAGGFCHVQNPQFCAQQTCTGCANQCSPQPPTVICPTTPIIPPTILPTIPPIAPTTIPPTIPPTKPTCPPNCYYDYIRSACICYETSTLHPTPSPTTSRPYCPIDCTYENGLCVCYKYKCPEKTAWDGTKCTAISMVSNNASLDVKHFINNFNNITNPTNVNVNNENTVYVYTADERVVKINGSQTSPVAPTTPIQPIPPASTEKPLTPGNCCIVVMPRICTHMQNRWVCHNRRYHRCGSFCTYPKIHLRPVRPARRHSYIVVPPQPISTPCLGSDCGLGHADCSGCVGGGSCSSYCHEYNCGNECQYYDHRQYCEEYSGQPGCSEIDGCYEDWCS